MNETQEKLFDEMRHTLEGIKGTLAGNEPRRQEFDRRILEVSSATHQIQEHLTRQDGALQRLAADLSLHLTQHRSLRRARVLMGGAAAALFSGAVALYLTLVTSVDDRRRLGEAEARTDTTLADVAVMTIACYQERTDGGPRLLSLSCGEAVARVEARLDGTLTNEAHR